MHGGGLRVVLWQAGSVLQALYKRNTGEAATFLALSIRCVCRACCSRQDNLPGPPGSLSCLLFLSPSYQEPQRGCSTVRVPRWLSGSVPRCQGLPGARPRHSGPQSAATSIQSRLIFHLSLFCSLSGSLPPVAQADTRSVIIIDAVAGLPV